MTGCSSVQCFSRSCGSAQAEKGPSSHKSCMYKQICMRYSRVFGGRTLSSRVRRAPMTSGRLAATIASSSRPPRSSRSAPSATLARPSVGLIVGSGPSPELPSISPPAPSCLAPAGSMPAGPSLASPGFKPCGAAAGAASSARCARSTAHHKACSFITVAQGQWVRGKQCSACCGGSDTAASTSTHSGELA